MLKRERVCMNYKTVKELGVGSAGDAYLLEDGKVIVIGKREDSFQNYQSMFEKMRVLDGKISAVNYPKFYELISPCNDYPYGAVVEEYIAGDELRKYKPKLDEAKKEEIGKVLAQFIQQVHNIKAEGNKAEEIAINLAKFDKSLAILQDFLSAEILNKLAKIKSDYLNLMQSKDFCITHGDLNAGNIMIKEDGSVSGVIDFGNMEYYIPEIEFVHMYFFDKTIYESMVSYYSRQIKDADVVLLELVVNVRHFKNIKNFEDRKNNCLNNIKKLLNEYLYIKNANKNYLEVK